LVFKSSGLTVHCNGHVLSSIPEKIDLLFPLDAVIHTLYGYRCIKWVVYFAPTLVFMLFYTELFQMQLKPVMNKTRSLHNMYESQWLTSVFVLMCT